ncbi:MAG: hypothetical protein ACI4D7_10445 [Lachnospiraceae bacterium]
MLSVVSVGISNYPFCELQNIPCAGSDSEKIYDAFKNIMDDEFAEHTSICLKNISAIEFIHLLDSLRFSFTNDEDTMVLYFSGHACSMKTYGSDTDFSLAFCDFNEKILCGYVSLANTIIPILNKICCNIVLILDCCYSGEGLKFATSIVGDHQISVMTATSNRMLAEFTEGGSQLANAIISGIKEIKIHNEDFTLNTLQQHIQVIYPKAQINMAASKTGDIFLKKAIDIKLTYFDLEKRFLQQIQIGEDKYKEAMWYAMSDLPLPVSSKIISTYFHSENENSIFPVEANWLVRRAIGSSIACIEDISYRRKITNRLIESLIWQEQCIGIIGARYDIRYEESSYDNLVRLINNKTINKIDAVWLANLYASDNEKYDYCIFLSTSLAQNSWGLQEIYKTALRHGCNLDSFCEVLNQYKIDTDEWYLQYVSVHEWETSSSLYRILCEKNERGRLPANSKAKFILSSLYGNWRGHKLQNFKTYFKSTLEPDIKSELQQAGNYCQIEYKMAIFEYFITEHAQLVKYLDSLKWGLYDPHPWVRRTAIQAFKAANIMIEECNQSIISYILSDFQNIGELDLIIEYNSTESGIDELLIALNKSGRYNEYDIESVKTKFYQPYNTEQIQY